MLGLSQKCGEEAEEEGREKEGEPWSRRPPAVTQVTLAEAHEHLLVPVLDVGAALLAVAGRSGHALSVCRNPVIFVTKCFVNSLQNFAEMLSTF